MPLASFGLLAIIHPTQGACHAYTFLLALLFFAVAAPPLGLWPTMSQATSIDANLNFDLKNSDLASVQAFPNPGETSDNWTTQFLSFSKVQPVAGDTLDINLNFVDALTGDQQRLQITNHGPNEFVRVFDRLDGSSTLSVQALTT